MAESFSSSRLYFTPTTTEDRDISMALMTSPEVMKFISGVPRTEEQVMNMLLLGIQQMKENSKVGFWVIKEKSSEMKIGNLILRIPATDENDGSLEVGYTLLPIAWGKGYATEALGALIHHVQSNKLSEKLSALIDPKHPASRQVLLKHSFILKGYRDYISPADGKRFPSEYYEKSLV